jgi:shikimate kinase
VKADKIYLVGFMAAGKTTLARALARRLDWQAVDIDEAIEKRERMAVADIFARHGEAYFRAVEQAVLLDFVPSRHLVVATGGGTFVDPANRAAINADGVSFWLDIPLDRVIARMPADGRRPLAADRVEFERLYHLRRFAYQQAHVRLDAGRTSVDGLVEQVLDWLQS